MPPATWKSFERRVCRALGGERKPQIGQYGWTRGSDCSASVPFAVEIKRTSRLGPPVLSSWVQQAKRNAKSEERPWLVVVGGHYDRKPVVCLDFDTFVHIARRAGLIAPSGSPPILDEPNQGEQP